MDSSKFFSIISRFNSLLLSLLGIGVGLLIVLGIYNYFRDMNREAPGLQIGEQGSSAQNDEVWRFAHMISIPGTDYVALPLTAKWRKPSPLAVYESRSFSTHNYLFINEKTDEKQWMLPHSDYLFDQRHALTKGSYNTSYTAYGQMFEVITKDTNDDGKFTDRDKISIAFVKPDGTEFVEVLPQIDKLLGHSLTEANSVLILYQIESKAYSARFELNSFTLTSNDELPMLGNGQ